jgi:hypothetical protein
MGEVHLVAAVCIFLCGGHVSDHVVRVAEHDRDWSCGSGLDLEAELGERLARQAHDSDRPQPEGLKGQRD